MRHHLKHLAMCAPMIVLAAILLATGSSVTAVIPLAACALMMVLMMSGMDRGPSR